MWWNDYVGIPYKLKGRDREGLDCWGLVRLIHKEKFENDIPSFEDKYQELDRDHIQELLATQREGWISVDLPQEGDVVLLRILGTESHVGIYIGNNEMIHAMTGDMSVIERLDSAKWEKRVVGFYRYLPNYSTLSALAHPLKTTRIDTVLDCTKPLSDIEVQIREHVPKELHCDGVFMVDGRIIAKDQWETYIPTPGQRIEYRAVPTGDSAMRLIGTLALIYVAVTYGPDVASFVTGSTVAAGTAAAATATAAITIAGTMLINSIFPVRQPEIPSGFGTTKSQLTLQGGQNTADLYGAVPVVLGKVRYTPPVGAINYVETVGSDTYLRMLLVWGYGELVVTDMRIDSNKLSQYEGVQIATIGDYDKETNAEEQKQFNAIYGRDVVQSAVGIELLSDGTSGGSPWREEVLDEPNVSKITVAIAFPNGLRGMYTEGGSAGKTFAAPFKGDIQYRQLNPDTLSAVSDWFDLGVQFNGGTYSLDKSYFNTDNDAELEKVYTWHLFAVDKDRKIIHKVGDPSTSSSADPSSTVIDRWRWEHATWFDQGDSGYYAPDTYQRIPTLSSDEELLWSVCVYGDEVFSTVDSRTSGTWTVTGCGLTYTGLKVTLAGGTIDDTAAFPYSIEIGDTGESKCKAKDAFTYTRTWTVDPDYKYEVRVRRRNNSDTDTVSGQIRYHAAILDTITGYSTTRPVYNPKGTTLCMTALRIKATDQLNGHIDGIVGTVTSVCKDYDSSTGTWINRPTRNPASLFRYVLQHPANAQKVADSKIDLTALESWHNFCRTNKFMFDMVVTNQRSLLDVMRDICAAGRASPTMRDGKWTVIIDKARTSISQFFTPHNSWGFEGTRTLPKMPHGFRVTFNNQEKSYQPDEMIVYNDGYSASNATILEGLSLPGVTTKDQIFKHARFHLAQIKLRPETYTLNVDMEHLICTRGDLVRVTHDVPMWGLGTGRIKNYVDSNTLELDEAMPMDAGVQYTIRIRLEDGTSVTRTVAAKGSDGYYSTIDLTTTLTSTQGKAGNLFMFGSLNDESVDLIVQSIEPSANMTARLTLVDYSPAVYDSDDEPIPAFDSQITKPPVIALGSIVVKPTITSLVSDESVMKRLGVKNYECRIKASFSNPRNLPSNVAYIEGQLDIQNDNTTVWSQSTVVPIKNKAIYFADVDEGVAYKIRLRYQDAAGRVGPWVTSSNHTVVGKKNPPSQVEVGIEPVKIKGDKLKLDWVDNPEPDVEFYEVRTTNSGWGTSGHVYRGAASTCDVDPAAAGTARTWYIKAIDGGKNYSTTARSVSYTVSYPSNVTSESITQDIVKTGKTVVELAIDWADVSKTTFAVAGYEIRTANSGWGTSGYKYKGRASAARLTSISATTTTTFYIKAYDVDGNYSATATSFVHDVTAPATMANCIVSVTRKLNRLYFTIKPKSGYSIPSLPRDFSHYEFQVGKVGTPGVPSGTTDNFWDDADVTKITANTLTSVSLDLTTKRFTSPLYSSAGVTYRVALRMVDKSGNPSPASALGSIVVKSLK